MELAPGKLEKNLPGGKGVLAALLKEFRNCEFNGMIHTSVYRGDDAADGILLFRNGKEIVAGHLAGRNATNGARRASHAARTFAISAPWRSGSSTRTPSAVAARAT